MKSSSNLCTKQWIWAQIQLNPNTSPNPLPSKRTLTEFSIFIKADGRTAKLVPLVKHPGNSPPSQDDFIDLYKLLSRILGSPFNISDPLIQCHLDLPYDMKLFNLILPRLQSLRTQRSIVDFEPKLQLIIWLTDFPFLWNSSEAVNFGERLIQACKALYVNEVAVSRHAPQGWLRNKVADKVLEASKYGVGFDPTITLFASLPKSCREMYAFNEKRAGRYSRNTIHHYPDEQGKGEEKKNALEAEKIMRKTYPKINGQLKEGLIEWIFDPNIPQKHRFWLSGFCLGPQEYCPQRDEYDLYGTERVKNSLPGSSGSMEGHPDDKKASSSGSGGFTRW